MSTARRGREIFSSEKILVTESLRFRSEHREQGKGGRQLLGVRRDEKVGAMCEFARRAR